MGSQDLAPHACARNRNGRQIPALPKTLGDGTVPNTGLSENSATAARGFVSTADAPRAACSRDVRRAWAAEVNRVLRQTGDRDQARRVGAVLVASALDCDALSATVRNTGIWGRSATPLPGAALTLPRAARNRSTNRDAARDRLVQAILRDQAPNDPDWPGQQDAA
jgi:hypothetical protein